MRQFVLFGATCLFATAAHAQWQSARVRELRSAQPLSRRIVFGDATYTGKGCPQGSLSVTSAPDSSAVSLLFDSFQVIAGGADAQAAASCSVLLPMRPPAQRRIVVKAFDYRGYALVPKNGLGRVTVKHTILNKNAQVLATKSTSRDLASVYDGELSLSTANIGSSTCGKPVYLRVDLRLLAQSNKARKDALLTLDSSDGQVGLSRYRYETVPCN